MVNSRIVEGQAQRACPSARFSLWVARHRAVAEDWARCVVADPQDAVEVVQEALLVLHRDSSPRLSEAGFCSLLQHAVFRIGLQLRCRIDQAQDPSTMPLSFGLVDPAASPWVEGCRRAEERLEQRELAQKILTEIIELQPEHRRVLLLREVDGLSYHELSEHLGIPIGTVMSRLHYARKKVQVRLESELQ